MNDFDFEELDKAVSSLASKTRTENNLPQSATPAPMTVTPASRRQVPIKPADSIAPSSGQTSAPRPSAPKAPEVPEATSVKPSTVQHAQRLGNTRPRRGAFMDIVAPSKSPTRHGATTLQPISSPEELKVEASTPEPTKPQESSAPTPPKETENPSEPRAAFAGIEDRAPELMAEANKPVEPQSPPKPSDQKKDKPAKAASSEEPSWPDPLDFHDDLLSDVPKREDLDKQTDEKPADEPPKPDTPSSPFLPDAKVEKRPLGSFSNLTSHPEAPVQKPVVPEEPAEAKPAQDELSPEKDGTFKEPKAPTMHDAKTEEKRDTKSDMQAAAMMSIPDQYHTKAKPADTSARPVFDTKEYHPPLVDAVAHEHRGGSSIWSKLFIALVVLVLLGVGAYFAYLYIVQR